MGSNTSKSASGVEDVCSETIRRSVEVGYFLLPAVIRHKETKQIFHIPIDANLPTPIYYEKDFLEIFGSSEVQESLPTLPFIKHVVPRHEFYERYHKLYKYRDMIFSQNILKEGVQVMIDFIEPIEIYQMYVTTEADRAKLPDLTNIIHRTVNSDPRNTLRCLPETNDIVLAPYEDKEYRRAKVVAIHSEDLVDVQFLDHGEQEQYIFFQLYPATKEIIEFPLLGIGVNILLDKTEMRIQEKIPNYDQLSEFLLDKEITLHLHTSQEEPQIQPYYIHYFNGDLFFKDTNNTKVKLSEIFHQFYYPVY